MKRKLFVLGMCFAFCIAMTNVSHAKKSRGDVVENGKRVKIDYTLTVDGRIVDTTRNKQPLEYEHGKDQILPGLSSALEGMKKNKEKTITVAPEQGYGLMDPRAFGELGRTSFPAGKEVKVGMPVEMTLANGSLARGVVSSVDEKNVIINFNHPLAGKTLIFDVRIIDIE